MTFLREKNKDNYLVDISIISIMILAIRINRGLSPLFENLVKKSFFLREKNKH